MTTNKILTKVKEFYEVEIKQVKLSLENNFYHWNKKEVVNNAIQRGLGVAFFVQALEVPFKDIDAEYEKFREIMYEILKELKEP